MTHRLSLTSFDLAEGPSLLAGRPKTQTISSLPHPSTACTQTKLLPKAAITNLSRLAFMNVEAQSMYTCQFLLIKKAHTEQVLGLRGLFFRWQANWQFSPFPIFGCPHSSRTLFELLQRKVHTARPEPHTVQTATQVPAYVIASVTTKSSYRCRDVAVRVSAKVSHD
jgi:hypothetical protein